MEGLPVTLVWLLTFLQSEFGSVESLPASSYGFLGRDPYIAASIAEVEVPSVTETDGGPSSLGSY
eukprot:2975143-Amphidinium_carterae.1